MTTEWYCEGCNKAGSVKHEPDAGILEVVSKVKDSHIFASPNCEVPVERLKAEIRVKFTV
jgi:hypothetical protein